MKIFHCDRCQQLLYFENSICVNCSAILAYLPDAGSVRTLAPTGDSVTWTSASGQPYRLCQNYREHNICNWAVATADPNSFCFACRLTRTMPDLSIQGHIESWQRLEIAKRRLVFTLLSLDLPVHNKIEDPQRGLVFDFLADNPAVANQHVLTGHNEGVIVINIAEADDAERERRRVELHEPYRTPLGHFRHEIGHYYWDILIKDTDRLVGFRTLFGEETADYDAALQIHYQQGAPADWPQRFISAYATSHPWEDWAETWAHYLHMVDALETATASGLILKPVRKDEPTLQPLGEPPWPFEEMVQNWYPLTLVLNNLNRGLGLRDVYPFLLPNPVIDKLRFIGETIAAARLERHATPAAN